MKRLLPLLLLIATASAQYHFTEVGVRGDAGVAYVPQDVVQSPGFQVQGSMFLTHFFCGKSHGYQVEAGGFVRDMGSISGLSDTPDGSFQYRSFGLQGAAYYKYRVQNYHRPKEWFFLIGPRFQLDITAEDQVLNNTLTNVSASLQENGFSLAASASVWRRLPMNKNHSFFVGGGVDYHFLEIALHRFSENVPNAITDTRLQPIHAWLGFGFTFYNNR